METGTPYMLYKAWHLQHILASHVASVDLSILLLLVPLVPLQDAANRKSNQQNLGTIHCSNLCTEIIEYTSPDEEPLEVGDVGTNFQQVAAGFSMIFPPDLS